MSVKDYPASYFALVKGGICTAFQIGPRVLITAAHCLEKGETISITRAPLTFSASCTRMPGYVKEEPTEDLAICALSESVPQSQYETISGLTDVVNIRTQVLLTGFGCTSLYRPDAIDGQLRAGTSTVGTSATDENNFFVTVGGAAGCFGDSGGAVFLTGDGIGKRIVAGVMSRTRLNTTFVTQVSTQKSRTFIAEWLQARSYAACGFPSADLPCRARI